MGQIEILEFLERNKDKRFTTKEIAAHMPVTRGSVCESMKRMRKMRVVHHETIERHLINKGRRPVMVHWYKEC